MFAVHRPHQHLRLQALQSRVLLPSSQHDKLHFIPLQPWVLVSFWHERGISRRLPLHSWSSVCRREREARAMPARDIPKRNWKITGASQIPDIFSCLTAITLINNFVRVGCCPVTSLTLADLHSDDVFCYLRSARRVFLAFSAKAL
jgi:hypothetical protein